MKNIICLLLLSFALVNANAQNPLKPTELNIFKNGTYFIVKEGNVGAPDGKWKFVSPLPLLSTFWLTSTKDSKIQRIEFATDTLKENKHCLSLQDFIYANKGKQVNVTYAFGDKQVRTLVGILDNFIKETGIIAMRDATGKTYFINSNNIVEFSTDKAPIATLETDSLVRYAKVYFNKSGDNIPVRLSYMQSGINWVPSYNIKVMDDKQLQLEMKALVENYSEAIANTDVTVTVGSPQFKYGNAIDPLALDYPSQGDNMVAIAETNTGAVAAMRAYDMATSEVSARKSEVPYNDFSTYTTEGEKTNDLYMYKLGKTTLPMNSKISFSIFSASIPYEDIYEVSISDVVNYANTYQIINTPDQTFDVFHSYKLTNTTAFPFTTAPVFVQDEKLKPLAQDMVKYTPVGGKVKIQLSKSPDVTVKNKEEEIERQENAKTINKQVYRKVTIRGSINVENLQDKNITLIVTKNLTGMVNNVSDDGTINKSGRYAGLNANTRVEWNVKLTTGEKKTITYEYEVYVYGG